LSGVPIATRLQLLPDVIDVSFVFTFSGGGGLVATCVAAALQLEPERLGRVVVLGNVLGAAIGSAAFLAVAVGIIP
jgi:hypothetical protein